LPAIKAIASLMSNRAGYFLASGHIAHDEQLFLQAD
jgi:hypothetical protein